VSVQLQILGHADATPTSKNTTPIAVQLLWRLGPFYERVFHLNQSVSYLSDMADAAFWNIWVVPRKDRVFRGQIPLLMNVSNEELRQRYRFGRDINIVFQQIYLITLISCKFLITKILGCIQYSTGTVNSNSI
jgi:hypothetical protein